MIVKASNDAHERRPRKAGGNVGCCSFRLG